MRFGPVLLALCLVTAGCSSGVDSPATSDGISPQPTPTPTPVPTADATSTSTATRTVTATRSPTATPSPTPTPRPVLGDSPADVYVADADVDRNFTRLAAGAIDYWNENASRYGWYAPDYRLTDDRSEAEVIVVPREEIADCGDNTTDTGTLGCAPLLTSRYQVSTPVVVSVKRGYTDAATRATLIHEFGHTLGIDHGDEPSEYMTKYGDGTRLPQPNVTERKQTWSRTNLTVALTFQGYSDRERGIVRDQLDHVFDYVENGADGTLAADYRFRVVDDAERADITIHLADDENACDGIDGGSCVGGAYGHDVDRDEPLEYYTSAEIRTEGLDPDRTGWYTAYYLAALLGLEESHERPSVLRGSNTEDADDRWWR